MCPWTCFQCWFWVRTFSALFELKRSCKTFKRLFNLHVAFILTFASFQTPGRTKESLPSSNFPFTKKLYQRCHGQHINHRRKHVSKRHTTKIWLWKWASQITLQRGWTWRVCRLLSQAEMMIKISSPEKPLRALRLIFHNAAADCSTTLQ